MTANDTLATASKPERRCVLTGAHGSRDRLIRLAIGPDHRVAPDVRAKAPGRGAWIGVDRAALTAAIAKGKLRSALARAFHDGKVEIDANLPERIETALARACLDRLGLEARAGTLITGSDRIETAARAGQVALLFHAADSGEDGRRRLAQAWRVGDGVEGSGREGVVIPATRAILSLALGRENVVHAALIDHRAAERVLHALSRWCDFMGRDGLGGACVDLSQAASVLSGCSRELGRE
jgi:predicted RNA-binding protein YlxR (DUF448 family)